MEPCPLARLIGTRTFTQDDQRGFAATSLDCNPMHMDPVAARRLISGRQVVHGIHTLLWALDYWHRQAPVVWKALSCEFKNPVNVDDAVQFSQRHEHGGASSVVATVNGLVCTQVRFDDAQPGPPTHAIADSPGADRQDFWIGPLDRPLSEPPSTHERRCYRLPLLDAEPLSIRFPHVSAVLGPERLAAIAALSRFVGMVCPGLHSVFSSVRICLNDASGGGSELRLRVTKYDARFQLFVIGFEGCIRGEIRAFVRPPPQAQPSMGDVVARVRPGEFAGSRSLVIGGSRGLGETVAKILAGGGGEVTVTHAHGADDAHRVAQEIDAAGLGTCTALKLDLAVDVFASLKLDVGALDAVYYFATPRIFRKKAALFDRSLLDEFNSFYVDRLAALCAWLDDGARGRRIRVLLPSTVFVLERPPGLTEYAMAKASAEILAQDLNRSLTSVEILCRRLPRVATDQTASIMKLETESSLDVLLPVVRDMNRRPTSDTGNDRP